MSILLKLLKGMKFGVASDQVDSNDPLNFSEPVYKRGATIICFTSGSEGDALSELTKILVKPISSMAKEVVFINIAEKDWSKKLFHVLEQPVWFCFSFFALGQDISVTKNKQEYNIWESAKIPFLRVYGDLPAYLPNRHKNQYINSVNLYGNPEQADYFFRQFEAVGMVLKFSPISMTSVDLDKVDYKKKSQGKVIFPKNGNSPNGLRDFWKRDLPYYISAALMNLSEEIVSREKIDLCLNFDQLLLNYCARDGLNGLGAKKVLHFMAAQLDDYLRRVKSTMIAEAVLDLPVVIKGVNWDHLNFHGRRVEYIPSSDYLSTEKYYDEGLAILDMSPNTFMMPHDRVLRSVGRGTAFITNHQAYIPDVMGERGRYAFKFNSADIKAVVESAILNPEDVVRYGRDFSEKFRERYPDEKFANEVVNVVDLIVFKMSERPGGAQNFVAFDDV